MYCSSQNGAAVYNKSLPPVEADFLQCNYFPCSPVLGFVHNAICAFPKPMPACHKTNAWGLFIHAV